MFGFHRPPSSKERSVLEAWKEYADTLNEDTDKMSEVQAQGV